MKKFPYQSLIGGLMYLTVASRLDIAYAVSYLSQFNSSYNETHWKAAKRVLRYLKGTMGDQLVYRKNGEVIKGFGDADWANCTVDRKSYSGFVFMFAGGAISWGAKKQQTTALSSTEAEYVALTEATKEAIFVEHFFKEFNFLEEGPLEIFCDNQGAKKLSKNSVFHSRTKHIDVKHHFIRDAIINGRIVITYLPTEKMPADVCTKSLGKDKFKLCKQIIGLRKISFEGENEGNQTSLPSRY